jgi:large subunit ribosomal protein L29
MKASELRSLSSSEITEKVGGIEEEIFNLRFQSRTGQLSNPLQLRMLRRDVARARTVLREKAGEKTTTSTKTKV